MAADLPTHIPQMEDISPTRYHLHRVTNIDGDEMRFCEAGLLNLILVKQANERANAVMYLCAEEITVALEECGDGAFHELAQLARDQPVAVTTPGTIFAFHDFPRNEIPTEDADAVVWTAYRNEIETTLRNELLSAGGLRCDPINFNKLGPFSSHLLGRHNYRLYIIAMPPTETDPCWKTTFPILVGKRLKKDELRDKLLVFAAGDEEFLGYLQNEPILADRPDGNDVGAGAGAFPYFVPNIPMAPLAPPLWDATLLGDTTPEGPVGEAFGFAQLFPNEHHFHYIIYRYQDGLEDGHQAEYMPQNFCALIKAEHVPREGVLDVLCFHRSRPRVPVERTVNIVRRLTHLNEALTGVIAADENPSPALQAMIARMTRGSTGSTGAPSSVASTAVSTTTTRFDVDMSMYVAMMWAAGSKVPQRLLDRRDEMGCTPREIARSWATINDEEDEANLLGQLNLTKTTLSVKHGNMYDADGESDAPAPASPQPVLKPAPRLITQMPHQGGEEVKKVNEAGYGLCKHEACVEKPEKNARLVRTHVSLFCDRCRGSRVELKDKDISRLNVLRSRNGSQPGFCQKCDRNVDVLVRVVDQHEHGTNSASRVVEGDVIDLSVSGIKIVEGTEDLGCSLCGLGHTQYLWLSCGCLIGVGLDANGNPIRCFRDFINGLWATGEKRLYINRGCFTFACPSGDHEVCFTNNAVLFKLASKPLYEDISLAASAILFGDAPAPDLRTNPEGLYTLVHELSRDKAELALSQRTSAEECIRLKDQVTRLEAERVVFQQ